MADVMVGRGLFAAGTKVVCLDLSTGSPANAI